MNSSCNLLSRFEHFQHKYLHTRPADCTFYAGIMALGCNIGIHRIIQTAPLINESELNTAINWYFTLDNINTANDAIGLLSIHWIYPISICGTKNDRIPQVMDKNKMSYLIH